jgi:hypothetical protein
MTEKIVVYVEHDDCVDSPASEDGWQVHSFGRRHHNFKHPDNFEYDDEFALKLKAGLAFSLSYHEHGQCVWSLTGDGPQCQFDTVDCAGVIVWEQDEANLGPSTLEERRKDAESFLKVYTDWCNGECYHYRAVKVTDCPTCGQEEETDENYDSCGGFIGADDLCEGIRESLGDGPFEWRGDASGIMDFAWKEAVA